MQGKLNATKIRLLNQPRNVNSPANFDNLVRGMPNSMRSEMPLFSHYPPSPSGPLPLSPTGLSTIDPFSNNGPGADSAEQLAMRMSSMGFSASQIEESFFSSLPNFLLNSPSRPSAITHGVTNMFQTLAPSPSQTSGINERLEAVQHIATHCNTLQHTATQCNAPQHPLPLRYTHDANLEGQKDSYNNRAHCTNNMQQIQRDMLTSHGPAMSSLLCSQPIFHELPGTYEPLLQCDVKFGGIATEGYSARYTRIM